MKIKNARGSGQLQRAKGETLIETKAQ